MPNHSCETLTIKMFDDVLENMEQRSVVAFVLLDLSAAFDTVDHVILLRKLQCDFWTLWQSPVMDNIL